ncbi:hypothetical protein [Chromobacterium phragmitis]|uniref:hypothetical protein n=1 Tax=Chromobacterium phragmitis TaxID=2202141 RepID=UPI00143D0EC0|nr:hypothetical protein [Chromobacterium phragmitis]
MDKIQKIVIAASLDVDFATLVCRIFENNRLKNLKNWQESCSFIPYQKQVIAHQMTEIK